LLAARVLRFPRAKVIAEGVGDYSALAGVARRGMTGTVHLADAALRMMATAYTADCSGCSGVTASGRPAGHGIVAVDPRYIPLGTRLYIPGYGHALAGDTGSAIRGNRIDLGFESHRDALRFGRRSIVVYVFDKK
jgi:3D (Asp-Asp-Asp) domain-containing protein